LLPDTLLGDNTLGVDLHAEPAPAACATGEAEVNRFPFLRELL